MHGLLYEVSRKSRITRTKPQQNDATKCFSGSRRLLAAWWVGGFVDGGGGFALAVPRASCRASRTRWKGSLKSASAVMYECPLRDRRFILGKLRMPNHELPAQSHAGRFGLVIFLEAGDRQDHVPAEFQ